MEKSIFKRVENYLIGDLLFQNHDTLKKANITIVYYIVFLSLLLLVPLQFLYLFIGSPTQSIIGLISIAVFGTALVYIKTTKQTTVVAHGILIFSTLTYALNTFLYREMNIINGLLLSCNIIFVFNLFDKKTGAVYASIHALVCISFMIMIDQNIDISFIKPIKQTVTEQIASFSILFIVCVTVILHYQSAHQNAAKDLSKSLKDLKISEERRKKSQSIAKIGNWELHIPSQTFVFEDETYKIFGIEKSNADLLKSIIEIIHIEDKELALKALNHKNYSTSTKTDFRIVTTNGAEKYLSLFGELQSDESGNPIRLFGVVQDIHEIKQTEEKLEKLLSITNYQNEKLKNFAYIVSHNIRSHSSNITSLVEILLKTNSEEEKNSILIMLKNTASNLEETLSNLNEMIHITENISKPKTKIRLEPEIKKTLEVLSAQIIKHGVEIKTKVSASLSVHIIPSYLDSILLNLISNAIKYRSLERNLVIEIEAKKSDNYIILSVKDNGLGIDLKKNGSKLFGMYKTFHSNEDARGIGLFITKNQIEAMRGKIEVESEENVGTTFKVYFDEKA